MTDHYTVRTDLDTSWMVDGNCLGLEPDLFFSGSDKGNMHDAKDVCAKCVCRAECLDYAMAAPERFGCWGGTSPHERRELRKEWKGRTLDAKVAIATIDKTRPPRHGTHAGYQRHIRAKEPVCADCLEATRSYRREQVGNWRRANRKTAS